MRAQSRLLSFGRDRPTTGKDNSRLYTVHFYIAGIYGDGSNGFLMNHRAGVRINIDFVLLYYMAFGMNDDDDQLAGCVFSIIFSA